MEAQPIHAFFVSCLYVLTDLEQGEEVSDGHMDLIIT